jgi:hypothetical protein
MNKIMANRKKETIVAKVIIDRGYYLTHPAGRDYGV